MLTKVEKSRIEKMDAMGRGKERRKEGVSEMKGWRGIYGTVKDGKVYIRQHRGGKGDREGWRRYEQERTSYVRREKKRRKEGRTRQRGRRW